MTSQEKYDECLIILSELHDISHTMIETGMDAELSAVQLLEEALNVIKSLNGKSKPEAPVSKKEKKLLH
jgi:hypothetical protein